MDKENFEHISYKNCPHFTVGRVDQWGEQGYLLYEGMVYQYYEDRKNQYGKTYNPQTVQDFLKAAQQSELEISESFLDALKSL